MIHGIAQRHQDDEQLDTVPYPPYRPAATVHVQTGSAGCAGAAPPPGFASQFLDFRQHAAIGIRGNPYCPLGQLTRPHQAPKNLPVMRAAVTCGAGEANVARTADACGSSRGEGVLPSPLKCERTSKEAIPLSSLHGDFKERSTMVEIKALTAAEHMVDWISKNEGAIAQGVLALIGAVMILVIGFAIARIASAGLRRVLARRTVDKTIIQFSVTLLRYALIAFAVIAALGRVGVETSSIIAVVGATGLAIGLALQGSLSNFAAGILLVSLRPFKAGEYVDLGGAAGTVEEINIFSTSMCMADNKVVVVPNSKIISGNIINFSRHPYRRIDIPVGVAYHTDVAEVKAILAEVVKRDPRILHDLGNTIRLMEMAAPSLNYVVRVWVNNADYWDVYFDLVESIKTELDRHQICIPYQQLEINVLRGGRQLERFGR
jgi:small conductance mechanosensitive channel